MKHVHLQNSLNKGTSVDKSSLEAIVITFWCREETMACQRDIMTKGLGRFGRSGLQSMVSHEVLLYHATIHLTPPNNICLTQVCGKDPIGG